jgi:hypothetical protein
MSLSAIIEEMQRQEGAMPLVEAQIMTLREVCDGYMVNPFVVGDLVKPKRSSGISDHLLNRPWIVVEKLNGHLTSGNTEKHGSAACFHKVNIRTAVLYADGSVKMFWHASHDFERWTEDEALAS